MTPLTLAENLFRAAEVSYQRHPLGLVVPTTGAYEKVLYPVLLSEDVSEEAQHLQGVVWFPRIGQSIVDTDKFCEEVNEWFNGEARLGFNTQQRAFWVGRFFDPNDIADGLQKITAACDILQPLCKEVAKQGSWNHELVGLAFDYPEDLPQA